MGAQREGNAVPRWKDNAGCDEAGFTLLELLCAMILAGLLMATAVGGVIAFAHSQQQRSSAEALLASLRGAQAKAVAEGRTYCVRLDTSTTWSTWRYSCDPNEPTTPGSPTQVDMNGTNGTASILSNTLTASPVSGLAHSCPSSALGCSFFYPRGLASSGQVVIGRTQSSALSKLTVVGVTGRVFLTH